MGVLAKTSIGFKKQSQSNMIGFVFCDLDWIRTNDPQLRRLMLYPAELPSPFFIWFANIG